MILYSAIFKPEKQVHNKSHDHEHEHRHEVVAHGGCCKHDVEHGAFNWWHPIFHCL